MVSIPIIHMPILANAVQGCCTSRPAEDGQQQPAQPTASLSTHHHTSSTRAIAQSAVPPSTTQRGNNRTLRPQPSLSTTTSTPRASTAQLDPERSLTDQPNAPLRQHPPWTSKKRVWTTSQLARERYEFFETRVTGSPEIWAAIKTATELMRDGDLATAQEILTAAGVTLPTGDLVNGAFDSTGNLYKCPSEIVSDPVNVIVDEAGKESIVSTGPDDKEAALGTVDDPLDDEATLAEQRREEKGKGKERDAVKVKCRLSDRGGPDVIISIGRSQHVGVLARRVASQAGISRNLRVRVAYLGKILKENETLDSQGWKEGHVINALVSVNPEAKESAGRGGGG